MGTVIDSKDIFMHQKVKEDAVQFIPVGESGDNYCLTLSKEALVAIRQGKSFPIQILAGDRKKTIVVIRDTIFKRNLRLHQAIMNKAKEDVQAKLQLEQGEKEAENLAETIGQQED